MVGITTYGVYLPNYQLSGETIQSAWNKPGGKGSRTVASFDEDSLTMGVAACLRCLDDMDYQDVDALYFASTTPPYGEKMNASVIATALDLKRGVFTMDVGSSLRSGSNALKVALDAVASGSRNSVLIAASDNRLAEPGSYMEPFLGDGAVAIAVGENDPVAEIVDQYSVYDGFPDVWRKQDERFLRHDDVRYSRSEDYARNMEDAVRGLFGNGNYKPGDFSKVVLFSPDPRSLGYLAKKLGFEPEQVQDPLLDRTGVIGSGHGLMMLSVALDQAKPDELMLFANYGDGADVFAIRTTDGVATADKHSISEVRKERRSIGSYTMFLAFRDLLGAYDLPLTFTAIPLLKREEELNVRLHGKRCKGCGTVVTLGLKTCPHCKRTENFEDMKLSKKGKVVTYSQEYYYPTPEPPVTMAVIDLDGGGRILAQMTDAEAEDIKVEMPVEMTFRKLHTGGGFVNYSWKCKPLIEGGTSE